MGLAATHALPTASTLCGACAEVCPVKIPIPDLLIRLRGEATHAPCLGRAPLAGQGAACSVLMNIVWSGWAAVYHTPGAPHLYLAGDTPAGADASDAIGMDAEPYAAESGAPHAAPGTGAPAHDVNNWKCI